MTRIRNAVTRKKRLDSRQRRFRFNKQAGWKKQWGMPVREARQRAALLGRCLRCLKNKAEVGKRCGRCREHRREENKTRKR